MTERYPVHPVMPSLLSSWLSCYPVSPLILVILSSRLPSDPVHPVILSPSNPVHPVSTAYHTFITLPNGQTSKQVPQCVHLTWSITCGCLCSPWMASVGHFLAHRPQPLHNSASIS